MKPPQVLWPSISDLELVFERLEGGSLGTCPEGLFVCVDRRGVFDRLGLHIQATVDTKTTCDTCEDTQFENSKNLLLFHPFEDICT